MPDKPEVTEGDFIYIGKKKTLKAIVSSVMDGNPSDCEAIYIDRRNRAINVDLKWDGEYWDFVYQQPDGGYADQYSRLRQYVQKLRFECNRKI